MVPTIYNADTLGIRPDLVGREITTWADIMDPTFKGKTSILNIPSIGIMDAAMIMEAMGNIKYADKGNMTKEEIDETIDFLIKAKQDGQFRAFWKSFDESVNLMASGEVVIQSMWSPAVAAVRSKGIACKYQPLKEGYRAWGGGLGLAAHLKGAQLDAAYEYINWYTSGWVGGYLNRQGYYSACHGNRQGLHVGRRVGLLDRRQAGTGRHPVAGRQGHGEGRRRPRRRLLRDAHGHTSLAGTRSWTRTATWSAAGTSSSRRKALAFADFPSPTLPTRGRESRRRCGKETPSPLWGGSGEGSSSDLSSSRFWQSQRGWQMATIASAQPREKAERIQSAGFRLPLGVISYLQAAPLFLILGFFFLLPIAMIAVVSFWDYDFAGLYPDFLTMNYTDTLGSWVTWKTYLNTLKYTAIVWALTLVIGFWVAYFLAFHIRTTTMQMMLFLVCTVPFMTSNIIRMISWIPVLGRNGLVNTTLIEMGIIPQPIEWLLYSDFAVVLAMVHLYTLFMVTPIFNTLMRIDRSLIEAARDAGANGWQILWNVITAARKARHGDRLDLRRDAGHGGLLDGAGDVRRAERLRRADDEEPDVAAAISGCCRQCRRAADRRAPDGRRDPARRRYPQGALR